MKELQNIIHRHFEDPKQKKRYLAVLIALSMLVSFMVPLILMEPADSITKNKFRASSAEVDVPRPDLGKEISGEMLPNAFNDDANEYDGYTYSPKEMDLYTLLFGASVNSDGELVPQSWYEDCIDTTTGKLDINKALDADAAEFFLGYASDFCAFIEGDFTATEADAEGRLFIGGDLSFKKNWNYQIGSGDYGNFTPMNETEEYTGIFGYASAVVGGKLYRINTLSTGRSDYEGRNPKPNRHSNGSTVFYLPEEGLYKNFIVGNVTDSLHYNDTTETDVSYTEAFEICEHKDYPGECTICKAGSDHSYIGQSNELAQLYEYDNVKGVLEDTFDLLRRRSSSLSQIQAKNVSLEGNTLKLDLTNIGDAKTAYYNLESWSGLSAVEITVPADRVVIGTNQYAENRNQETITKLDINLVINCIDENIGIGNTSFNIKVQNPDGTYYQFKKTNENGDLTGETTDKIQISHFDGKFYTNNHPVSSNILYNFPNATEVTINGNFNGTILAPNAEVSSQSDPSPGHLSGALIAKSFYGGLEFGYRPYRGGTDIFGMTSGYEIPVDKLNKLEGEGVKFLPGAMFAIKDGDKVISLFETTNETSFAIIPSKVDFSGKTTYRFEKVTRKDDAEQLYDGVAISGEQLTAPVELTAYTSYNYSEESKITGEIPVIGKFYLKANQKVELEYNDAIYYDQNNVNNNGREYFYTIYLNKPVTSLTIKAKSSADNNVNDEITLNFQSMNLSVEKTEVEAGTNVNFELNNVPQGENIYYQYYVNGSKIGNADYVTETSGSYKPLSAGNLSITAKAYYCENQQYRLIAETEAVNVNVTKYNLPTNMKLNIPETITNGETLELSVTGAPEGATIKYKFYNSDYLDSYQFNTNDIIGKNLPVYAKISMYDAEPVELYGTVTVDFKNNITFSKPLEDGYTYTVDNTQQLNLSLNNVPNNASVKYIFNGVELTNTYVTPTAVGDSIEVKAIVTANSGDYELSKEVKITIKGKYSDNLSLSADSNSCTVIDKLKLSVSNAPNDAKVIFKAYDSTSGNEWVSTEQTINNGGCMAYFEPTKAGSYTVNAYMNYAGNAEKVLSCNQTIVVKDIDFTVTPESNNVNSKVRMNISNAPNGSRVDFVVTYPNGSTKNFDRYINNGSCSVDDFVADVAGTYSVKAKITNQSDNNRYTELYASFEINEVTTTTITTQNQDQNETTTTVNNDETNTEQTLSFSLRNSSAPTEENPNPDDNLIEIEAPESERIEKLTLTFPNDVNPKQATFTLEAVFTDSNGIKHTKNFNKDDVNDQNPYYLEITTSDLNVDIKKIEIKSIEGSINIGTIYPVYAKNASIVEKDYSTGFDIGKNEEYIIELEDWATSLEGMILNLKYNNQNISTDEKLLYTLLGENDTELVKDVEVTSSNNEFKIEHLTTQNVKKIKIKAVDSNLAFDFYTISAYQTPNYDISGMVPAEDKLVLEGNYTLVEQQAPVGYIKDDNQIYTINVKETIKAIGQNNNVKYPSNVDTVITVTDQSGNTKTLYSINTSYGETTDGEVDPSVRNIRILGTDDSFELKTNGDNLEYVKYNGEEMSWSKTIPDEYTVGDKIFYFDPMTKMVIPVTNDNHLKFKNDVGLLFRKMDDKGMAVSDVQIDLYKDNAQVTDKSIWDWKKGSTSEQLLKISDINSEAVYSFRESDTGGKYEQANAICFEKINDTTIHYWSVAEDPNNKGVYDITKPTDETKIKVLNLNKENIIRMENIRITGIKIFLEKTDLSGVLIGDESDYAKFSLHAMDGTTILEEINVKNGRVELDFSNFEEDTEYVENKYLKPGTYYLTETNAPSNYQEATRNFYFNVIANADETFSISSAEVLPGVLLTQEIRETDNGNTHRLITFKTDAFQQIPDDIAADTPIIQFTFYTSEPNEITDGYGNGIFNAKVNNNPTSPDTSKYPPGCSVYENNNTAIKFESQTVNVKLTVQDLCDLFDVDVANFRTITEFVIDTTNSTTVKNLDFYPIDKPFTGTEIGAQTGGSSEGEEIFKGVFYNEKNLKITSEALKTISSEIINNETDIISLNLLSSDKEIGFGSIKITGKYDGVDKSADTISITDVSMDSSWNAREILEALKIELNEGENLEGKFSKLTELKFEMWNSTKISEVKFLGQEPADDNDNNTENDTPTETSTVPTITVVDNVIKISNKELGLTMDLNVKKAWEGDKNIEVFRKPVQVNLLRRQGEGDYAPFNPESNDVTVTLDSTNNWNYTWSELPRFVDDDYTKDKYYYKVLEISEIPGYTSITPDVNINDGGNITITNTIDKIDIPVKKNWEKNDFIVSLPKSIKVKIQAKIEGVWTDLPGKTLELTGGAESNEWSGIFEDLPKGFNYQIVEVEEELSSGWAVAYNKREVEVAKNTETISTEDGFKLTNSYTTKTGNIGVEKIWPGGINANLPYKLQVALYQSIIAPSYTETDYTDVPVTTNYARLLQHSLYFYDTNMCGDDVAANSAISWRTNCHTNDEIPGGYHDAGDHVMFGLAQGFAASTLGWSYYEFKDAYVNSNQTDHYKIIMKRFCELFKNGTVYEGGSVKKVLMQKGRGNKGDDTGNDHTYWGPPEAQPDTYVSGRTRSSMWSENGNGGNVAAEYAASLALYALNFPEDPDSAEYLQCAKDLYDFALKNTGAFSIGNYTDGSSSEEIAWAAVWLSLATNDNGYITSDVMNTLTNNDIPGRGHYWENPILGAKTVYACHIEENSTTINEKVKKFFNDNNCNNTGNGYKIFDSWGSARHNTLNQLAALAMDKNCGTNYKAWCAEQMGYLLGNNNIPSNGYDSTCFITGFAENSARNAHHRAASGYDAGEYDNKNATQCVDHYDEENGKTLIGALVGGPKDSNDNSGSYSDIMDGQMAWETNEVALDYNAGLVGAAAGLYYFNPDEATNKLSTEIVGVEYNKYGLGAPDSNENGIKSPTESAVPESVQPTPTSDEAEETKTSTFSVRGTLNTAVNSVLSRSFGVGRNTVKATESSSNNTGYSYVTYNSQVLNWNELYDIDVSALLSGIKVEYIEFIFEKAGNFKGFTIINNNNGGNYQQQYDNDHYITNGVLVHPGDKIPQNVTSVKFKSWGEQMKCTEIRFYYVDSTKFFITPEKTDIALNEKIKLTLKGNGTIEDVSSWTVNPSDAATITKEGDNWYLTAGATVVDNVNVIATDADGKTGTAIINIKKMAITGADSVGLENNIVLDKQYAQDNATKFVWRSSDTTKATVDQTGKVVGIAPGSVTITLEAKDVDGNILDTAEKVITVKNVRVKEFITNQSINRTDGTNKCEVSLADIPSYAKITKITANLNGNLSIEKGVHEFKTKDGAKYQTNPAAYTLNGDGSMSVNTSSLSGGVLCGTEDSYYSFQIWWAGTNSNITVTSIVIEYEMDSTYIEIQYEDETDTKTIRKNTPITFEVEATGGEIGSVQLMKDGVLVENYGAITGKELTITEPGVYQIVAAMAGDYSDRTDSIELTVKDDIAINGDDKMDLGASQTLTVDNLLGQVKWEPVGVENTDYTKNGNIVTFKNGDKAIATFNLETGVVEAGTEGGTFKIRATDQSDNTSDEIEISISERPKVPVLPSDTLLVKYVELTKGNDGTWKVIADGLPLTDDKGNPYYYYIQESGYWSTSAPESFKSLTDEDGHYVHSSDATYIPISYYNNGIVPVESGTPHTAKVENKLTKTVQGQMPSSGGVGRTTYYFFGGMIMLLSAAGYTCTRRRQSSRRAK